MNRLPGTWSWRDEQLAAEHARRQDEQPPDEPLGPDWEYALFLVRRYWPALAVAVLCLVAVAILVTRQRPATKPRAVAPHATQQPTPVPPPSSHTAWTTAEAGSFSSGLWASLTVPGVVPRTGPAQLWPALSASSGLASGERLVALGIAGNSQESDRWVAVRLPTGDSGWLPAGAVALSGTLQVPRRGRPDSYIVTGSSSLIALRRPRLPDAPGHVPPDEPVATVAPGSAVPLRGVLPRYFDGRRGTQWVRVHLPHGGFGWLLQDGPNLRRDIRYLLPPPGGARSPWASPLPAGVTMLGAYGEALGTAQWALRGGTDVRGQAGDRVRAVADGVVILTGYSVRWARYYVVVRHNGAWEGWQTAYMGLAGSGKQGFQVREGQAVRRGQVLGYLAAGAYQQPTSLHFVVQTPDGTPIESQNVLQWP